MQATNMRRSLWCAGVVLGILIGAAACDAAPIKIVTTLPDMADFARRVGGVEVDVQSIATGEVDPHFFVPRPRHARALNRAELLIMGGMGIDCWVNALIDSAQNPDIRFGARGYLDPAIGVTALEVPEGKIDGSHGDVHPFGNPHYWFTEKNALLVTKNIADKLCELRPGKAAYFKANEDAYRAQLAKAFAQWRAKLAPFKGAKIVQYHRSWVYFAREHGLEIVGDVESKPGIPASARHLRDLIDRCKAERAALLVAEPYYPEAPIATVTEATGMAALRLPLYVGGRKETPDFLSNTGRNVEALAAALGKATDGNTR